MPYINDNGSWSPEYFDVSDSTGTVVGVVRTADAFGDEGVFPHPVYSLTDKTQQVGYFGQHGYWAVGEPEAWCEGCKTTTTGYAIDGSTSVVTEEFVSSYTIIRTSEAFDADGNKTSSEVEVIHRATPTPTPTP